MCKTTRDYNNTVEVTAEFCLKCKKGYMVVEKYYNRYVISECKKCGSKHKIRYYRNGRVDILVVD